MQLIKHSFLFAIIAFPVFLLGQEQTKIKKGENLYLVIDSEPPYFITGDKDSDSTIPLGETQTLSIRKNRIDVYTKWVNPLRYTVKVNDSAYADPRNVAINDFISRFISQFNISKATDTLSKGVKNIEINTDNLIKNTGNDCLDNITFNRPELFKLKELYKGYVCRSDVLKQAFLYLKKIEERNINKKEVDIKTMINKIFTNNALSEIKEINKEATETSNKIADSYTADLFYLLQLELYLEQIKNSSDLMTKQSIKEWLEIEKKSLEQNKANAIKLVEYVAQINKSVERPSKKMEGYYWLKNIAIPDGKEVLTSIQITKNKLNKETLSTEKESEATKKIILSRYDIITPSVGTGVFFASTSLNSFGVATNDNGDLVVSENVVTNNTAVTGLFLNLNFDINSRYLSPLFQIGIDPTKKYPFLLLGGGFSIPSSNFSISGGPIWTWEASLNKLNVDEVVESTSALEKDISHSFKINPKGYYIGLSYNF